MSTHDPKRCLHVDEAAVSGDGFRGFETFVSLQYAF